ncbi:MAG: hypothetical protein ACQET8_23010 [Bacillota bacterium]
MDRFLLPFEEKEVGECGSCEATIYDGDEYEEYSTRLLCVNCEAEKTKMEEKEIEIHAYIEDHVKYFEDTPDIETIKHQFELYTEHEPMIENILKQYDGIAI